MHQERKKKKSFIQTNSRAWHVRPECRLVDFTTESTHLLEHVYSFVTSSQSLNAIQPSDEITVTYYHNITPKPLEIQVSFFVSAVVLNGQRLSAWINSQNKEV